MKTASPAPRTDYLEFAGYLTIIGVGITGVLDIPKVYLRWSALGLLIIFSILYFYFARPGAPQGRWPTLLYFIIQTALVAGMMNIGEGVAMFALLFFVLSAIVFMAYPLRLASIWMVVFSLITAYFFIVRSDLLTGLRITVPYVGGYFFFGVFANAMLRARTAQAASLELLEELQSANTRLREYSAQVETLTAVQERNRLAREMHDTIGHHLTVAAVQLEGAQRLVPTDPQRADQMLTTVREQVREALADLRQTVAALRQPLETDLSLLPALRRLADSFQQATGLTVQLNLPARLPALPGNLHLALYRAAQEGLTNVQRHARGATQAWLALVCAAGRLTLTVRDDGQGFSASPGTEPDSPTPGLPAGFGLHGLRERATQLGGESCLEQVPGGAQLTFWVPTQDEECHD